MGLGNSYRTRHYIYNKYACRNRRKEMRKDNDWDGRHRCWLCGGELIWDGDFNYDEVHGEGEGIVAFLHCSKCYANVQVSLRTDEDE